MAGWKERTFSQKSKRWTKPTDGTVGKKGMSENHKARFADNSRARWMRYLVVAVALAGTVVALIGPIPGNAWFFFIAKNGMRQQWVFNSGCNPNSRPITVTYDTDDPSNGNPLYGDEVQEVHNEWNQDGGLNLNLMTDINVPGTDIIYKTMDVNAVNSYLQNPEPGVIRVVWDADGAVLQNLGVDPENVLGIGVPLAIDNNRPNEVCSGLMILNGFLINQTVSPRGYYRFTLLHELGHVLGFAHSIAGKNDGSGLVNATETVSESYVPVMHPFSPSSSIILMNKVLTDDEKAGLITVYGQ